MKTFLGVGTHISVFEKTRLPNELKLAKLKLEKSFRESQTMYDTGNFHSFFLAEVKFSQFVINKNMYVCTYTHVCMRI